MLALGHDTAYLGTLLTAALAGGGVGVLPGGRLADRYGARRVLLGASVLTASGIALQLFWPLSRVLLAGNVIAGIGAGAYYVAAAPFLARIAAASRSVPDDAQTNSAAHSDPLSNSARDSLFSLDTAVALGSVAFGTAAAAQLAAVLLPRLQAPADAYRWALLAGSAVGAWSFVALWLTREDRGVAPPDLHPADGDGTLAAQAASGESPLPWYAVLRDPNALYLTIIAVLVAAGAGLFAPYLNVFFVQELGASPAVYGWLNAAALGVRLLATLAAPAMALRIGTARAVGLTQLASVPLLLLLGFSPLLAVAAGAYLVRGALMNMAAPLQMSFRMAVLPAELRGSGNALILVADSVTRAASTWVGGALIAVVGFRAPYAITALCYVSAAMLWLWWFGRKDEAAGG